MKARHQKPVIQTLLTLAAILLMLAPGLLPSSAAQTPAIPTGAPVPSAAPSDPASETIHDNLPTNAASTPLPPSPVPNLAATLMAPTIMEASGPVQITGVIANVNNQSGEARAHLYAGHGVAAVQLHEFVVPTLTPGESIPLTFEWAAPVGITRLRLVVDSYNSVFETDETDNVATSWLAVGPLGDSGILVDGPRTSQPTWGSPQTILFQDRPMHVEVDGANGLSMHLEDGDPTGQPVWINTSWLKMHGIERPVFTYDNSSHIPFEERGHHYLVRAPHFSVIHATDAEASIFDLVQGGDAVVAWNTALDRVDFTSAASDAQDESLLTGFVSHRAYAVNVVFGVDAQGHDQELYPLALGSKAERTTPTMGTHPASSFGYRYISGDLHAQPPTIEAYYRRGTEPAVPVWTWTTPESPDFALNPHEGWSATLQLRRAADEVFFELLDVAGNLDRSVAVPTIDLPPANVDSVLFANHGASAPSAEATQAWAGSFTVEALQGDLVLDEFHSAHWTAHGTARVSDWPDWAATLTRDHVYAPADSGRVALSGCPDTSSFSAQFQYTISPAFATRQQFPGFVFFFAKNLDYAMAPGPLLGFEDASAGSTGHEGFGVVFDGRQDPSTNDPGNGFVALVQDSLSNRLASVLEPRINDQQLHTVNVERHGDAVLVYFDGLLLLHAQLPPGVPHQCVGFSSSSGDDQVVVVHNLLLSSLTPNAPPTVPNTPSPAMGSTDASRSPALTWTGGDPQGTATGYWVNIDTQSPPRPYQQSGLYCQNGGFGQGGTHCVLDNLVGGQTYYWQVTSDDGVYRTVGPVWSFTPTANTPPQVPSSPQPATGATAQPVAPLLSWTGGDADPGDTLKYRVFLDTVSPPATTTCTWISASSCSAAGLSYDSWYYWRVEARDESGAVTPGPVWAFRTLSSLTNHAPLVPSNPSPFDGRSSMRSGFVALWNGGDQDGDVVQYDVYVTPQGGPVAASPFLACSKVTLKSCTMGGFLPSTTYRWQVRATDGHLSTMSPSWSFTTGSNGQSPRTPTSPFPADGSLAQSVQPTLRWAGGDWDGDLPRFDVYLAGATDARLACSTFAYECSLARLAANTPYQWWVVAFDGVHEVTSPVWDFTTRTNALPILTSPSPADSTTDASTNPKLTWAGTDPDGTNPTYAVWLSTNPNVPTGGNPTCNAGSLNECQLSGLADRQTYYWRVKASDEFGTTQSPIWSFTTAGPATNVAPTVTSPNPPHHSDGEGETTWLRWVGDDENDDDLTYNVYFTDDDGEGEPSEPACVNIKEANCMLYGLQPGETIQWLVEVTDGLLTTQGPTWDFTVSTCQLAGDSANMVPAPGVIPDPIHVPSCTSVDASRWIDPYLPSDPDPKGGASGIHPFDLTLRWMGQNPAGRSYTVYLDLFMPPTTPVCRGVLIAACDIDQLIPGHTYYWQVSSGTAVSQVLGPTWSFTTPSCVNEWCPTPSEKAYLGYPSGSDLENPSVGDGDSGLPSDFDEMAQASLLLSGSDPLNLQCGRGLKNRACTVLVVHGYAGPLGQSPERNINVVSYFDKLPEMYDDAGYYDIRLIGYYGGECGMGSGADATNAGALGKDSHSEWSAGRGHQVATTTCNGISRHSRDADIGHLAYHFAWYVYNTFSKQSTPVDIVAHSMGGLIVRYALHYVQIKDPSWPPLLLVESIIDYASPHDGANFACPRSPWWAPYQERQMCKKSGFLNYLRNHAQGPQGQGGTRWSLIGGYEDIVVSEESSVDMDGARYFVYKPQGDPWYCGTYDHMDFFKEDADADGHDVDDCFLFDYTSAKRNMIHQNRGKLHDPGWRPIKLGLFEAVT